MKNEKMFSILVPVYNQRSYLEECIESAINQSYRNFELILVDDGSSDGSEVICDTYHKRYPNLIKVVHKKNEGLLYARYTGIKESVGKYLLFLDADDCIKENILQKMKEYIEQYDGVDLIIFNASRSKKYKSTIKKYPIDEDTFFDESNKKHFIKMFCGDYSFNNMWIKCIKRNIVDLKTYLEEGSERVGYGEDLYQSIPIINEAKKIFVTNNTYYFYRPNTESMTHNFNYNQFISTKLVISRLEKYAKRWERQYKVDLNYKVDKYMSVECYRTAKNIFKGNNILKIKRENLNKLNMDPFFNEKFYNKNMMSYLKSYEKIIYLLLKRNSSLSLGILNSIFKYPLKLNA